jgi:hypothetical protein
MEHIILFTTGYSCISFILIETVTLKTILVGRNKDGGGDDNDDDVDNNDDDDDDGGP